MICNKLIINKLDHQKRRECVQSNRTAKRLRKLEKGIIRLKINPRTKEKINKTKEDKISRIE